jgi:hypothetical protein
VRTPGGRRRARRERLRGARLYRCAHFELARVVFEQPTRDERTVGSLIKIVLMCVFVSM